MARLEAIADYWPTITMWNRLEGRPRTADFDRALRAEVRDPLWLLSKQWQMGQFMGDDAGSPVLAKLHMETTELTRYQAGTAPPIPLGSDVPLETKVEQRPIAFERAGRPMSLDVRLLMGRHWLKLVAPLGAAVRGAYVRAYGIEAPNPDDPADAGVCAHPRLWQQVSAVAGRRMDGYRLYAYLKEDAGRRAHDGVVEVDPADHARVDDLAARFVRWFEELFSQPIGHDNPSWKPDYLEYGFGCSAPSGAGEKVLVADEYYHGHLDWYNLDVAESEVLGDEPGTGGDDVEGVRTHSFVPTSVTFGGMPHPRWWTFENWRTNLSFVKPDTTDLNKLLLLDFFLRYSDDWFIVPVTVPVGTLSSVRGLMVTNVFGEKIWVRAAGRGSDEDWQRWNMYTLARRGVADVEADTTAVTLPVARKVQEGKPTEDVVLIRDEIVNMVWGVETAVPLESGVGAPGREVGRELHAKLQRLVFDAHPESATPDPTAPIRYEVAGTVPEHWIPFVPVHVDEDQREIQLQRAAMPRILQNDPGVPRKIEPKTSLLRAGLDRTPPTPYFVHEEEIPRAGIRVRSSFQRTRWFDGAVHTWVGLRKQVGRGEGSSGLGFDQIHPVPFDPEGETGSP